MTNDVLIETPKGLGYIDNIYVSELGFLMLKIKFDDGTFTGYNLGQHDSQKNMFTEKLFEDELIGFTRD